MPRKKKSPSLFKSEIENSVLGSAGLISKEKYNKTSARLKKRSDRLARSRARKTDQSLANYILRSSKVKKVKIPKPPRQKVVRSPVHQGPADV